MGPNETEARQKGIAVRVARLPVAHVFRAMTTGETAGFLRVLVEATGDRILGFTVIGADVGEVTAVYRTAMLGGVPFSALRDQAILAHPTMARGLAAVFRGIR